MTSFELRAAQSPFYLSYTVTPSGGQDMNTVEYQTVIINKITKTNFKLSE